MGNKQHIHEYSKPLTNITKNSEYKISKLETESNFIYK